MNISNYYKIITLTVFIIIIINIVFILKMKQCNDKRVTFCIRGLVNKLSNDKII